MKPFVYEDISFSYTNGILIPSLVEEVYIQLTIQA